MIRTVRISQGFPLKDTPKGSLDLSNISLGFPGVLNDFERIPLRISCDFPTDAPNDAPNKDSVDSPQDFLRMA